MEGHEGGQGLGKIFKIFGQTPVSCEPGERALDHPAARQDDQALRLVGPVVVPWARLRTSRIAARGRR